MVSIGEESGNTNIVLQRIAESYEKDIKTDKKVRSAVTYPTVLFILMLGVIVLLVTTVMPMFKDILSSIGGSIPPFTEAIVNVSSFIGQNIIAILLILAALLLLFDIYRNTLKGRALIDRIKLVIPVQKDITIAISALRFARNMAMLLRSGIDIARSFVLLEPVMANKVLSESVRRAAKRINEGGTLGEALIDIKLFPKLLIKLLAVAESTGHIEAMFDKAADLMEEDLDSRLERLTTILEPLLIIILSLILGIILLSVIFPVIGIMNSIG
jgi:type IV pilus assembly protein PilC